MRGPARSKAEGVFKNVQRRMISTAQLKLIAQLPAIMEHLHTHAVNLSGGGRSMTGNWLNSFGVVLYRDGSPVAIANMTGEGTVGGQLEDAPIRTTLINDERFKKGTRRHDDTYQRRTFTVGNKPDRMGSSSNYFADDEVIRWLSHSRSNVKDGFSYRVVSVIEYNRDAARQVLLNISDEIESFGGNIWQFHLG